MAGEEDLRAAEERGDADELYGLAADWDDEGEEALAERACLAAAKLGHVDAIMSYAHILYERDDAGAAIEWWSRAADAGDAEGAFNAGVALEDLGRYDDALASYRRAADAGHAPAHTNIGILLEHRGDGIGAEHSYRTGVEQQDAGAAFNLGVLLYRRGDDDGARAAFTQAQELGEGDAVAALQTLEDGGEPPDPYDEEAVRVMVEQGNTDPGDLLPVEHWLYLPSEQAARSAAQQAGRLGFSSDVGPSVADDGRWTLRVTRQMYARPEAFARARHPLVRLALDAGGEYDGWEAPKA